MKKLLLFLFCIPILGITQNSHTINTAGNTFSPSSLTINVGDTVIWNNTGGYHNVNGTQAIYPNNPESFGNGVAPAPWSFQWVFTLAGTYDYQCDPHIGLGMTGVVVVNSLNNFAADLFISEYAEGSGTNKYIEIFNGTGQDVDLSNYQLWKVTNGGTWPEYTFNLSSILSNNHVYIVYSSSSSVDPIIAAAGDVTWSQVTWTGDDAVGLAKQVAAQSGSSFVLIDAIGEDGPDPGTGWNVAGVTNATKDHTLVRKCSVTQGNTNWSLSSGTNAQDSEWEVFSQNYWTDIDQHTFPCQSAPVYGCTDSTAINFDPLATIDDGSCISLTFGCTDSTAFNYNATANSDDGSCCFQSGCTNPIAYNYDPSACYNDGSCITPNFGCMNASAMNFDSTATIDDSSCIYLADKVDLFFSEYGEGSSNNKYIEIYNSTSNPVDLSSYALARVSNAPTNVGVYEYWVDFDSAAVVLANDVYIVAHSSADSVILAQSDMTYSSLSNGDDGFALVYGGKPSSPVLPGNEYIILDFLGDFNGDPGSGWDVAGVSEATKDHVLIRKCDINIGNTNWTSSAGTDSLNSEWTVLANEDWSDIGQHTNPCQTICTDNEVTLNLYDSFGDGWGGGFITIDSVDYTIANCLPPCNGYFGSFTICVDLSICNDVIYHGGWGNFENSWEIIDVSGVVLASGNDNSGSFGSCAVYGCTDSTACNYDPLADVDDGSCEWTSCAGVCAEDAPTGLHATNVLQNRATINWDNMNDANCMVDQYRISYSDDGGSTWTSKTMGQPVGSCLWAANNTDKLILNLTPSTTYTYRMKAWYCGGGNSSWSANETFTTEDDCPNVGNLAVTSGSPTQATFTWNGSNGAYSFMRIKARVDTNNGTWFNVGGSGVNYGIFTKNKNGLSAGTSYRGQSRTWCSPNGGAWKSPTWTPLLFWTQPTIRLEGGSAIANLAIYPNPSKDVFNVTFTSEDVQDLKVRILNVIGEELISDNLEQFIGEYTKQINLTNNAKGIYFLEIETNNGVINKKLILQ